MEKKQVGLGTLIFIVIVILLLGIGVGYFITNNLYKDNKPKNESTKITNDLTEIKKEVQSSVENKISSTTIENVVTSSNVATETPIYDGSKNIVVNGKTYTVSYLSEKYTYVNNEELKQTEVKLYLNDNKIKTMNLGAIQDYEHKYGSKDYAVEVYNFCKDYILIVVKTRFATWSDPTEYVQFCVIDTNGEHIETLKWNNATSIGVKATGESLTYKINDDSLTIQESNITMKYTVIRNWIRSEILKVYDYEELLMAGK